MMLADHAEVADGKLFINGGGWNVMAAPIPFALAISIEFPWNEAGVEHSFTLDLFDDQGPVEVPTPADGDKPLRIEGRFPLAPALGVKRGSRLKTHLAINLSPPPPLQPGWSYEWRLEVDGQAHEDWRLGFATLPFAQSKAA